MGNIAKCACGRLSASASGKPSYENICHCGACRHRTGAAFGYNLYFPKNKVVIAGESRCFERDGEEGRKFWQYFCPECGTTVYWHLDALPDSVGIAGGLFDDKGIAAPIRSIWEESKYDWVLLPTDIEHWPQRGGG